jgi:hypothetical protein
MEHHVRLLATLSIVFGVFSGVAGLLTLAYFEGFRPLWDYAEASGGMGLLATGTVLFHLLLSVPMIFGGIFLRRFVEWARYVMVFLCAVNLLNLPLGSVLGAYGLWVLMMPETEPLFLDPVVRRNRALRPPQ